MEINVGLEALVARVEEAIGKKVMNAVFWVVVIYILAYLVWNTLKVILDISDTASEWGSWGQIAYTVVLYALTGAAFWGFVRWLTNGSIRRMDKRHAEQMKQIEERLKELGELRAEVEGDIDEANKILDRRAESIKEHRAEMVAHIDEAVANLQEKTNIVIKRHERWQAAYRKFEDVVRDFNTATGKNFSLKSIVAELEDPDEAPKRG